MQKVRRHPIKRLRPLVSIWFQVLLTPLTGVLFTFPSRYLFTIGRHLVFSLTPWSALIHTRFHVSGATLDTPKATLNFAYGTVTLYGRPFHAVWLSIMVSYRSPKPHQDKSQWFRLFPFRSPLLRESHSLSFPPLTEMFHFSGSRSIGTIYSSQSTALLMQWVSPFGNLRFKDCLHLPEAYRSLPRPSSPCVAKASAKCSWLFIIINRSFF